MHSNEKPHRCGGCRRVRRAWPGFEIDDSEPQVHAWREPRGPRSLAVGLGGGARGRRVLDGMCTAMNSPTGVEGAGGSGGLGRASRSTTPSRRFTHGGNREARVARGAGPRCRWAAAGPGRASRSTTPSRRLACGDLAGGRTRRHPEHPWGHKQQATSETGRAAAHRHTQPHNNQPHNDTRPRPVSQPRPRRAQSVPLRTTALRRSTPLSKAAPPAIRRSCPRGPRPRRGQPRGGRRGRGTGSRTRSQRPRCGRSGSTAGRHRARHTRRA